jgi:hypothetical protein
MKAVARTVLRYSALFAVAFSVFGPSGAAVADETIVMIRHGEKPELGLGQLTCQGLNRALALPPVLLGKFGKPAAIFAPNPAGKKDFGVDYAYIRPLATIEPTAIRLGLPVNLQWRFDEIEGLQAALTAPAFKDATLFVAWEHHLLEKAARELLRSHGGDAKAVPKWPGEDFDSIYVIRLGVDADGKKTASFTVDKQGLDKLPSVCP